MEVPDLVLLVCGMKILLKLSWLETLLASRLRQKCDLPMRRFENGVHMGHSDISLIWVLAQQLCHCSPDLKPQQIVGPEVKSVKTFGSYFMNLISLGGECSHLRDGVLTEWKSSTYTMICSYKKILAS